MYTRAISGASQMRPQKTAEERIYFKFSTMSVEYVEKG